MTKRLGGTYTYITHVDRDHLVTIVLDDEGNEYLLPQPDHTAKQKGN